MGLVGRPHCSISQICCSCCVVGICSCVVVICCCCAPCAVPSSDAVVSIAGVGAMVVIFALVPCLGNNVVYSTM